MNLTDSFILKCQCGCPVMFYDICAIYPATVRQIVEVGYDKFQLYLSLLTSAKPQIDKDKPIAKKIENLSDYAFLLFSVQSDPQIAQTIREAFHFFTHDKVIFSPETQQIIVGPIEEKHIINEQKFYELRNILKKMYCIDIDEDEIIIYETDDNRVKTLKKQMIENRKKVAKAKAKVSNSQSDSGLSLSDLIGSFCINDCGFNLVNVWDLTYYAFHDQLKRMNWRDKFDINHRAALAGAKIKKKELETWIKPISSKDK